MRLSGTFARTRPTICAALAVFIPFLMMVDVLVLPRMYFTVVRKSRVYPPSNGTEPDQPLCDNAHPWYIWHPNPENTWIPEKGVMNPIPPNRPVPQRATWRPKFCIVARTYQGNSPHQLWSIDKFLASLEMQSDPNWFLVLVDTDPEKPYPYLYNDLAKWAAEHDPFRIKIIRGDPLLIDPLYVMDIFRGPYEMLHKMVYHYTDLGIDQGCPADTEYLIATNADNWYHPQFLEQSERTLVREGAHFVGTDFMSRFSLHNWHVKPQYMTCQMFHHFSPAFCNPLISGNTDLGSMMFQMSRWRSQNMSFGLIMDYCGYGPSMADACLARHLRTDFGWKGARVPQMLFSHSPNAWGCIFYGGTVVMSPVRNTSIPEVQCLMPGAPAPTHIRGVPVTKFQLGTGSCYQQSTYPLLSEIPDIPFVYNASGRYPKPTK